MRIFLVVLMALFSYQAAHGADDPIWLKTALKKDEPNELAYYVGTDEECPFSEERATEIVEGVFVRSRIKPLPDMWISELYLSVIVKCMTLEENNPVFFIEVAFGKRSPIPILYETAFGVLGIGSQQTIESAMKDRAERAISAYLRANFDLGE